MPGEIEVPFGLLYSLLSRIEISSEALQANSYQPSTSPPK